VSNAIDKVWGWLNGAHVVLLLLGVVAAGGVSWGIGVQHLEDLGARVSVVERIQREDMRDLRAELQQRFNQLDQLVRDGK